MAPVDSRDYVLSGIYYSVLKPRRCAKHNVAYEQSQQTPDPNPMLVQCWPTICNAGPASNKPWISASCLLGCNTGLVVLTAGGEYKPTPTEYLLNVGPASPVMVSIYSALVSTSCWRYRHVGGNGTML